VRSRGSFYRQFDYVNKILAQIDTRLPFIVYESDEMGHFYYWNFIAAYRAIHQRNPIKFCLRSLAFKGVVFIAATKQAVG
jgi:hypothetical protein